MNNYQLPGSLMLSISCVASDVGLARLPSRVRTLVLGLVCGGFQILKRRSGAVKSVRMCGLAKTDADVYLQRLRSYVGLPNI